MIQPRSIETLYQQLAEQIKNGQEKFPGEGEGPIKITNRHGVYVILKNKRKVLHVGRTASNKKGLQGRMQSHLNGQSSFTIKYFNGKGSKLRESIYSYALLEVDEPKRRTYLEALAIGKLCPAHIGTGARAVLPG